jgi:hypothetical protein
MSIQYLHFDSILKDCSYNTSTSLNTYSFVAGSPIFNFNSFNCIFTLNQPLKNIRAIQLCSIELPISFPNVRAVSNLNTFSILDISNNQYNISLPDKNYNSITSLIIDLNTYYTTAYPSVNIVFSQSSTSYYTNNLQITSTNTIFTSGIYINTTSLSYMLGFRNSTNQIGNKFVIAGSIYNLNMDNYLNLYIGGINQTSTNPNNSNNIGSFKIPLNAVNGVVYYSSIGTTYNQIVYTNHSLTIQKITCVIYDRYGFSLNSNGLDYSFTLAFLS